MDETYTKNIFVACPDFLGEFAPPPLTFNFKHDATCTFLHWHKNIKVTPALRPMNIYVICIYTVQAQGVRLLEKLFCLTDEKRHL